MVVQDAEGICQVATEVLSVELSAEALNVLTHVQEIVFSCPGPSSYLLRSQMPG
jgi:hypothetical protein